MNPCQKVEKMIIREIMPADRSIDRYGGAGIKLMDADPRAVTSGEEDKTASSNELHRPPAVTRSAILGIILTRGLLLEDCSKQQQESTHAATGI